MAKSGVDGVFTADPKKDPAATLIKKATYRDLLARNIRVMDATAEGLLMDSNITTRVFRMIPKNFVEVANGSDIGTSIKKGW